MTKPVDPSERDREIRQMEQEAGLDRDLESQVPPRYGMITIFVFGLFLFLAAVLAIWLLV